MFEQLYACGGLIKANAAPEFVITVPHNLPCEILICVSQTDNRLTQ